MQDAQCVMRMEFEQPTPPVCDEMTWVASCGVKKVACAPLAVGQPPLCSSHLEGEKAGSARKVGEKEAIEKKQC